MTRTHCPYCALQCGMSVSPDGVVAGRDFEVNRGRLCRKGLTAGELLSVPGRLTDPLVRRDGILVPGGWDETLDLIATRIARVQQNHGPAAVGVFGGGGLTNEKAYALGKFARTVLRTPNIDYNGRFCMSSAASAANRTFGVDRGLPFPVTDLADAQAVLLVGANPAETMPPLLQHLTGARESGGLIVVDPRNTDTMRQASLGLRPLPGSDLALAQGMLHVAITEGLTDESYLTERTSGWSAVRTRAMQFWPDRVERLTGVPAEHVRIATRTLADARSCYVITARGVEQHANGTDTVSAFMNLSLALGLPGRPGRGYGTLTGQGNGQGGREHGQKADQLPGYRAIDDPAARAHVAAVWGVEPDTLPGPGLPAVALLNALGRPDGIRALLLHGSNPVVSAPDASGVADRIRDLDLLVVSDSFLSETAQMADVVLPVTQWAEEEGTLTNLEGRVLRRRAAVSAPAGVRSDLEVLSGLTARLRPDVRMSVDPEQVFTELGRASAGGRADYAGITYERLDAGEALYWPCPDTTGAGSPRLFLDRFWTADGRAHMVDVDHRPVAEDLSERFPLRLTTGRVMEHYQSGSQTRRIGALTRVQPESYVEMHPDTAAGIGLDAGDMARVSSERGVARAVVRVSRSIRHDTVFMPFHFPGDGRANTLTSDRTDPISGMPTFKACSVSVTPVLEAS